MLKEVSEEINRVLGSRKWPSVLGNEGFLEWVKNVFFVQKRHVEVPESRSLAPDVKKIKRTVCRSYGVKEADLIISRRGISNEPRNIAIFLMRNLKGGKLDDIGREFNVRQYSSVSTIIERTKQRAVKDRKFAKRIEQIKLDLKVSQEQT